MATKIRQIQQKNNKPRFVSLRWRMTFPLAITIMLVAMIGAYAVGNQLAKGFSVSEENILFQTTQSALNRNVNEYVRLRSEAQRVAYTQGISEAIQAQESESLHESLEAFARASDVDSIIVTDSSGIEVAGVLRELNSESVNYILSNSTDLSSSAPIREYLDTGEIGASGLLQTPEGLLLYVGVPVQMDDELVGTALVGQSVGTLADSLVRSGLSEFVLYNPDGNILYTTLEINNETLSILTTSPTVIEQARTSNQPLQGSLDIAGRSYRIMYTPFNFGENQLGVMGILAPENLAVATRIGRQMAALFASLLAAVAVIAVFMSVSKMTGRLNQISETADALVGGDTSARTGMKAIDEVGKIGQALDTFAAVTKYREDNFHKMLRRQRREMNYLTAILESMPDGVLVQDNNGKVVFMNHLARSLLGSQPDFQHPIISLEERIPSLLGTALAPGIYALGDPQKVSHRGKMLTAQAAAVLSMDSQRIGTVIILRDITNDVQREQKREEILAQLSEEIQQPLASMTVQKPEASTKLANEFAREISRHAASLQKMIVDMRELTRYSIDDVEHKQRPLHAKTFLLALWNDWRQIAQAANIDLRLSSKVEGVYILGDESRLRWACGNIVDNAIKYTPAGGAVSLEIVEEKEGRLHFRIRDNGAGISEDDLKYVFMPFYRGTPIDKTGQIIHTPGMGQGLGLCLQVIQAHGGVMKVKTRKDVGTAVYIALPLTSGASYVLPLFDETEMEGETVAIPQDIDLDTF